MNRRATYEILSPKVLLCSDFVSAFQPGIVDAPDAQGISPRVDLQMFPSDSLCAIPYGGRGAGDLNGDGYADLIVGNEGEGYSAYIAYGNSDKQVPSLESVSGDNGFRIRRMAEGDRTAFGGISVGDVNGDGLDDLAIGAMQSRYGGTAIQDEVIVLYGATDRTDDVTLDAFGESDGFIIRGDQNSGRSLYQVSAAGDVNGDGIGDMIVGTPQASTNSFAEAGGAYIIFGRRNSPPVVELNSFPSAAGVFISESLQQNQLGLSVAGVGDINNDGFDDVAVGSRGYVANELLADGLGYAMLIYGGLELPSTISPSDLDGSKGFLFQAGGARIEVSAAGDFNNDGIDDLAVADDLAADGIVYILYGSNQTFDSVIPALREPDYFDGTRGVRVVGYLGGKLTSIGDFNGDGVSDIAASGTGEPHQSFLLLGDKQYPSHSVSTSMDDINGVLIRNSADVFASVIVEFVGDFDGDGSDDIVIDSNGAAHLVFGTQVLNNVISIQPATGDLDRNGVVDAADIDTLMLSVRLGSYLASFDIVPDEVINDLDVDLLVEVVLGTSRGDSNLDGVVNFDDFSNLLSGFGSYASWTNGDFNGDGRIDFKDFLILAANFDQDV